MAVPALLPLALLRDADDVLSEAVLSLPANDATASLSSPTKRSISETVPSRLVSTLS